MEDLQTGGPRRRLVSPNRKRDLECLVSAVTSTVRACAVVAHRSCEPDLMRRNLNEQGAATPNVKEEHLTEKGPRQWFYSSTAMQCSKNFAEMPPL